VYEARLIEFQLRLSNSLTSRVPQAAREPFGRNKAWQRFGSGPGKAKAVSLCRRGFAQGADGGTGAICCPTKHDKERGFFCTWEVLLLYEEKFPDTCIAGITKFLP